MKAGDRAGRFPRTYTSTWVSNNVRYRPGFRHGELRVVGDGHNKKLACSSCSVLVHVHWDGMAGEHCGLSTINISTSQAGVRGKYFSSNTLQSNERTASLHTP